MKSDLSLQQLNRGIVHFLHRYHVLIFTFFVLGGLSVATFMLYRATTEAQSTTSTTPSTFDQKTIDRIGKLRSASDAPEPINLPAGRTNPFQD
jgi:hypothetical protein